MACHVWHMSARSRVPGRLSNIDGSEVPRSAALRPNPSFVCVLGPPADSSCFVTAHTSLRRHLFFLRVWRPGCEGTGRVPAGPAHLFRIPDFVRGRAADSDWDSSLVSAELCVWKDEQTSDHHHFIVSCMRRTVLLRGAVSPHFRATVLYGDTQHTVLKFHSERTLRNLRHLFPFLHEA